MNFWFLRDAAIYAVVATVFARHLYWRWRNASVDKYYAKTKADFSSNERALKEAIEDYRRRDMESDKVGSAIVGALWPVTLPMCVVIRFGNLVLNIKTPLSKAEKEVAREIEENKLKAHSEELEAENRELTQKLSRLGIEV